MHLFLRFSLFILRVFFYFLFFFIFLLSYFPLYASLVILQRCHFLLRTYPTLLVFCLPIKRASRCFFSLTTHTRVRTHTHTVPYYSPSVRNNTQVIADISCHSLAAARNCASGATLLVCSVQYQLKLSILINILIFLIRNVICFI